MIKKYLAVLSITLSLVLVGHANAQITGSNTSGIQGSNVKTTIENPFKTGSTLVDFLKTIVNSVLLPVGAVVAVMCFIWAGFKFVTAQGDEGKIKEARGALLWTVIGTLVLLGATGIINVVADTINKLKS